MNKPFLYFILLLLAPIFIYPDVGYSQIANQDAKILIRQDQPQPIRPRKPERIVIECFYDTISASLQFHFLEDLGSADITIINTSTGELFYEICSSTPGVSSVSISGEQGEYIILIEDGKGTRYIGSFTLD